MDGTTRWVEHIDTGEEIRGRGVSACGHFFARSRPKRSAWLSGARVLDRAAGRRTAAKELRRCHDLLVRAGVRRSLSPTASAAASSAASIRARARRSAASAVVMPSARRRRRCRRASLDAGEACAHVRVVPAERLVAREPDHAAGVGDVVGRVQDAAPGEPRSSSAGGELVVGGARAPRDTPGWGSSRRSAPRRSRTARARRTGVVERRLGGDGLGAGRGHARRVDVGGEHPGARLAQLLDQPGADRAAPCTSTVRPQVVGAERVPAGRADRVEHADRGALPRVAGAAVAPASARARAACARRSRPCRRGRCSCRRRSRRCRAATRRGPRSASRTRARARPSRAPARRAPRAPPCRRRREARPPPASCSSPATGAARRATASSGAGYGFMRVPPIAGPSTVECTPMNIQVPVGSSKRVTSSSPSQPASVPRTRAQSSRTSRTSGRGRRPRPSTALIEVLDPEDGHGPRAVAGATRMCRRRSKPSPVASVPRCRSTPDRPVT